MCRAGLFTAANVFPSVSSTHSDPSYSKKVSSKPQTPTHENNIAGGSSSTLSSFRIVGTVTLRGRSAVVWFGWGGIEKTTCDGDDYDDGSGIVTTTTAESRMAFSPSSSGTEDRPWVNSRCQCRRGTSEESTRRRCP